MSNTEENNQTNELYKDVFKEVRNYLDDMLNDERDLSGLNIKVKRSELPNTYTFRSSDLVSGEVFEIIFDISRFTDIVTKYYQYYTESNCLRICRMETLRLISQFTRKELVDDIYNCFELAISTRRSKMLTDINFLNNKKVYSDNCGFQLNLTENIIPSREGDFLVSPTITIGGFTDIQLPSIGYTINDYETLLIATVQDIFTYRGNTKKYYYCN